MSDNTRRHDDDDNGMPDSMRVAIETICSEVEDSSAIARVMARAVSIDQGGDSVIRNFSSAISDVKQTRSAARLMSIGIAIAATICFVVTVGRYFPNELENVTWAQVAEAVKARPWIKLESSLPGGETSECWFSASESKWITRVGKEITYYDYQQDRGWTYYPEQNRVIESKALATDLFLSQAAHWKALFGVDVTDKWKEHLPSTSAKIIKQANVQRDGRKLIEITVDLHYTFRTLNKNRKIVNRRVTFEIDPATRLPKSVVNAERVTSLYSFQETGPKDIYELGVLPTVPVIAADSLPKKTIVMKNPKLRLFRNDQRAAPKLDQ